MALKMYTFQCSLLFVSYGLEWEVKSSDSEGKAKQCNRIQGAGAGRGSVEPEISGGFVSAFFLPIIARIPMLICCKAAGREDLDCLNKCNQYQTPNRMAESSRLLSCRIDGQDLLPSLIFYELCYTGGKGEVGYIS